MPAPDDSSWEQVVLTRRWLLTWVGVGGIGAVVVPHLAGCADAPDVVVTGGVSAERASAYRDMVLDAIPRVEELWGSGAVALPVHIDLPSTIVGWAAATGHRPDQRGYAASTVRINARNEEGAGQDDADARPVRIVMHPDAWDELSPAGREAVVTHEVAHLAMGRGGSAPWWVEEGVAEFTAHRNGVTSIADIAGSALKQAAREPGKSWPEPSAQGDAWQGYARAWLACVFIAERHGESVLPEAFAAAAAGQSTPMWMQSILGERSDDVHAAWVSWLQRQQ